MQITQVFPEIQKFIANFPKAWDVLFTPVDFDDNAIIDLTIKKEKIFVKVVLLRSHKKIIPRWYVSKGKGEKMVSKEINIFEKELLIKAIEELLVQ